MGRKATNRNGTPRYTPERHPAKECWVHEHPYANKAVSLFYQTRMNAPRNPRVHVHEVGTTGDMFIVILRAEINEILASYWVNDLGDVVEHTRAEIEAMKRGTWRRPVADSRRDRARMKKKLRATRKEIERQCILATVHEAGHAVGRIMTAPALGRDTENAVFEITIEEGKMPTTWGPWLSREIDDGKPGTLEDVRRLVKEADARGVDVKAWALATAFQIMMGPAAEAKFDKKAFRHVWLGTPASNDRACMARDCDMAGVDFDNALTETLPQVEAALGRPEVWRLVLALARAIRSSEGLTGAQVAAIAREHLTDAPP